VEQVFYAKCVNKPSWRSVVRMKPRTLFAMPGQEETEQQEHIDIDSVDVGVGTWSWSAKLVSCQIGQGMTSTE
jgi:hypothetical protein